MEQEDQFTHEISLEDDLDPETNLSKVLFAAWAFLCATFFYEPSE